MINRHNNHCTLKKNGRTIILGLKNLSKYKPITECSTRQFQFQSVGVNHVQAENAEIVVYLPAGYVLLILSESHPFMTLSCIPNILCQVRYANNPSGCILVRNTFIYVSCTSVTDSQRRLPNMFCSEYQYSTLKITAAYETNFYFSLNKILLINIA